MLGIIKPELSGHLLISNKYNIYYIYPFALAFVLDLSFAYLKQSGGGALRSTKAYFVGTEYCDRVAPGYRVFGILCRD